MADNIEEKDKIEECEKKAAEYLAGWQRERADFLNYKKEEIERFGEILKYAGEGMVLKLLPILDNFEIAERAVSEDLKNNDNIKGLLMIKNQIYDFLKSQGVEEIKTIGEKFDPNFHEVVEEVTENGSPEANGSASSPQEKSGIIIEEILKGYEMNGKLLRPAKVKVSK